MAQVHYEIAVIGGGMAGVSVAAELSLTHSVVVIEKEEQLGYHSTGRSAALFSEIYGNDVVRALSRASRAFLFEPPAGFTDGPLVRARGSMFIAREEQLSSLNAFAALPDVASAVRMLDAREARILCPLLREGYVAAAAYEAASVDVEVHALHGGYLRQLKARGGVVVVDARDMAIARNGDGWRITVGGNDITASVLVDAAGAWADEVAVSVGIGRLGLLPCKRTVLLVDVAGDFAPAEWPFVVDVNEQFYFKPEAGLLLLSPADESVVEASDVQADEIDIAIAIDRVTTATTLDVRRVRHSWAGLRTFSADRIPVVGYDGQDKNFFWLAGQGGYGIQTAPALARAAAALVREEELPRDLVDVGLSSLALSPRRLRSVAQPAEGI